MNLNSLQQSVVQRCQNSEHSHSCCKAARISKHQNIADLPLTDAAETPIVLNDGFSIVSCFIKWKDARNNALKRERGNHSLVVPTPIVWPE
jgi:hypothetical protein